jgi:hypothetical protein
MPKARPCQTLINKVDLGVLAVAAWGASARLISWLVTSSQDPSKTSLFIKGLLLSVAPLAMLFLGWTETDVTQFADSLSNIAFWSLSIVPAGQVLWGLLRKGLVGRWAAVEA